MSAESAASVLAPYPLAPHLETLLAGHDLAPAAASEIMEAVIAGRVGPASIAALAIALRVKGESVDEIAAFAAVMRAHAVRIQAPADALDTCGTGGDRSETFNVSTVTALVAAGMGIPVAKHGGRSVSSSTGSADVLKVLGVHAELPPARIARCITETGFGFMFAPSHHPGMRHVAPVRRELGVRTVFNLLGPLVNPAGAERQLIGVCEARLCVVFAHVLQRLGSRGAMIVCGAGRGGVGALDEVSTFGPTDFARLHAGHVTVGRFDPESVGVPLAAASALQAHNAEESAALIRSVLRGEPGPARDIVQLNAAAAALVAGKADDWAGGLRLAQKSIDEGCAQAVLEKVVAFTNARA